MKKILALVLALCTLLPALVACNPEKPADSISICLASEPQTLDPALNSAVDGATMLAHLFSGLAKWSLDNDGKLVIVPDLATSLPQGVTNQDGTVTYTYTLKENAKWSDGSALTAGDFVYAWKRAASTTLAADYGYMFEVVKGYGEDDVDGLAPLAVEATNDTTLKVTLNNAVPYWNELLAFPTYFPVKASVVANDNWATEAATYVGNGAYKMASWTHDSVIVLQKNENFHDANSVKMPEIKFYLSDDANNMLTNFKNGDWLFIDDVPTDEIATLKTQYPTEFVVAGQIGTYYVCWNINEEILPATYLAQESDPIVREQARQEIRNAMALLLDRNYIVNNVSQAGEVPASSFVAMGMTNPDGTEFYKTSGSSTEFDGYYDVSTNAYATNVATAIQTLKKYYAFDSSTNKFTDVPTLDYLYNTNDGHKAIGEYIQGALNAHGITMTLENQEWATFLETRKNGDYSVARNGWVADYNDPICFLDMWTTASGNNDVQFGKGAHANLAMYSLDMTPWGGQNVVNGTWAQTYDVLISMIKSSTDTEDRYEMMHKAEDMLMATGCITPIYFYTDLYMVDDSVKGFFSNPLGYKYFHGVTID